MIKIVRASILGAVLLSAALLASPAHAAPARAHPASWVPTPKVGEKVVKRDRTVLRGPALAAPRASGGVSPAAASLPVFVGIWMQDDDYMWEHFWIGSADGSEFIPGSVFHTWENPDGSQSSAVSLNGWFTSGMDGFPNVDGNRLEIFGRAGGGDLVHMWEKAANGATGWSGWASLGGALQAGSGVQAYCNSDNTAVAWVVGVDGYLHSKFRNAFGVWDSNWQ